MHTVHCTFQGQTWCFPWALAIALFASGATATEVWVVTDSQHPVSGTRTPQRHIELDAAQAIEAQLSAQLPNDPQAAAKQVQQRLQQGGDGLQQRLARAYQDVTDAWRLGITTLPAVVVDQRYVVYGQSNLDQALARIARQRREQP
ncbi:integrating conjugative element protein, PFL_4709 family [Delftia tsuruhatensis]|nr:integrating conjugative element protein, PFL_4709 family [Delftia tsuruhatensis]CAC9683165.1 integrating conjugative element protein, PFL_4709 family [Delftia tsuruhatensis]